jgi:hypothetical protein
MELRGNLVSQVDHLNVATNAQLDGTLLVDVLGGFAPAMGSTFDVLAAATVSGTFIDIDDTGMPFHLRLDAIYTPTLVRLIARPSGDFNADGQYGCADIDSLVAQIVSGAHVASFDLNGDALVNVADQTLWLALAGEQNLTSEAPYLAGDANLDGVVDGSDFGIWNSNKFTAQTGWCRGNFNTDGFVDGSDFGIWNSNKFRSALGRPAAVPEPTGLSMTGLLLLLIWRRRDTSVHST